MTFTKERLTELSRRENVGAILGEEIAELARIALASLEAEPVVSHIGSKNALDAIVAFIKSNRNPTLKDHNEVSERLFQDNCHGLSNHVIEYIKKIGEELEELRSAQDSAPPASVSVPDEVTAEDCPAFVKYDVTDVDEAWARGFNACRAAMLQGADGNSPVIPDGWKLVPIDPTKDMLRAGQSVVGFWLNTVHCYSKMLSAAPAAPQQEVTQALAKGMEHYGDAMQKLADSGD
ncbi:TPA: hypothetical protein N5N82_002245 [Enterobacter kobei]|nr:hypothetical protein [Enterobacter kobei]